MEDRKKVLENLIYFNKPLDEIKKELSKINFASDLDLVCLAIKDLRAILERFIVGDISSEEVGEWSNLIEGREDISFEPQEEELTTEIIFKLANSEINEPITSDLAKALIFKIDK